MGFWHRLLVQGKAWPFDTYDAAQRVLPDRYEPFMGTHGIPVADPGISLAEYHRANVNEVWRTQPNVRKVVDFIARNVASIPLHLHERVSDTDRRRVTDHQIATTLGQPQPGVSPFRFWHSVLSDGLLYDQWAVLKRPTEDGGLVLIQIPSWRLRLRTDTLRQVTAVLYWVGDLEEPRRDDTDGWRELDPNDVIFDHGYAPGGAGLSPMVTLADVLAEAREAVRYRQQVWENGARVPAWLERPLDAPQWSSTARERFTQGFRSTYSGDGPQAGGVPLLEDGMKLHESRAFAPKDTEDLEGRRLSAIEVASAFHIAPELVGAREGTYSNVDAFRQMLYRDSLGPYITAWEGALNARLVPDYAAGRPLYIEAHVDAKLRGSFEEQAKVKQSATGAPWLTRNEARALENRPPVEGGDDLVVPLNVLIGNQASPTDSGSQNVRAVSLRKSRAPEVYRERAQDLLTDYFNRQRSVVLSRLGGKSDAGWWDEDRWDRELSDDLYRLAVMVSQQVGRTTLDTLGVSPDEYDLERTYAFLRAVSERVAGAINTTTRNAVDEALREADDALAAVGGVFDEAASSRAEQSSTTVTTTFSAFATTEAARQVFGDRGTKTWVVTSGRPRATHAAMNGETVPLGERFSNGAEWPGDAMNLDVDDIAGCQCDVIVSR